MKLTLLITSFVFCFSPLVYAQRSTQAKEIPFFDFDISGSGGNYNGTSYSELHLGLNMNFADWLTWRNAAFKRYSAAADQDISGLDTSLRVISDSKFENAGIRLFAGPGYRWTNHSDKNALFGEAGASFQIGRFGAGVGARYLKYDKTQLDSNGLPTRQDDINYFITLAGGVGLSF